MALVMLLMIAITLLLTKNKDKESAVRGSIW